MLFAGYLQIINCFNGQAQINKNNQPKTNKWHASYFWICLTTNSSGSLSKYIWHCSSGFKAFLWFTKEILSTICFKAPHTVWVTHHLLILHHDKSFILAQWFCLFNLTLMNLVQSFILTPQSLGFKKLWNISAITLSKSTIV